MKKVQTRSDAVAASSPLGGEMSHDSKEHESDGETIQEPEFASIDAALPRPDMQEPMREPELSHLWISKLALHVFEVAVRIQFVQALDGELEYGITRV